MIRNKEREQLYEELVAAGLPRLPEGFTYKFKVIRFGEDAGNLRCSIRETFLGFIPLWMNSHQYIAANGIETVWEIEDLVELGQFTETQTKFPVKRKRATQKDTVTRFMNRRLP